jgi:integrase
VAEVVQRLLAVADQDRLHAAWRLSLYGLRRGEVLGLRWEDVDLENGTLSVRRARVLVVYQVVEQAPKTKNGVRTLPMDPELLVALRALEGRHTALSLMEKAGVPISVVSRWAGHHDSSFTLRQYLHADHTEDMRQGTTALGQIYTLDQASVRNGETTDPGNDSGPRLTGVN